MFCYAKIGCYTIPRPILTAEDGRKGARIACERLGPAGRSARASAAAAARWGHSVQPKKDRLLPALSLVSAWIGMHMEDRSGRQGYFLNAGKLSEVLAWLRDAK